MKTKALPAILVVGALAAACGGQGPDPLGRSRAAIVNGEATSASSNPNQVAFYRKPDGYNWLSRPCTGTALSTQWVLTARHCTYNVVNGVPVNIPPERMAISDDLSPGIYGPPYGYTVPDAVYQSSTADVALLHVQVSANLGSVLSGSGELTLYNGLTSALVGAHVTCYGYGRYECVDPGASPEDPDWGAGTLRQGYFEVSGLSGTNAYTLESDIGYQTEYGLWNGDSGGACFWDLYGQTQLIGVHATGSCSPDYDTVPATDTATPVFRSWVMSTTGG